MTTIEPPVTRPNGQAGTPKAPPTREQIDKFILDNIRSLRESVAKLEKENAALKAKDINTTRKLAVMEKSLNESVRERRVLKEKMRVMDSSFSTLNRNQAALSTQTTRLFNEHKRYT